MVSKQWTPSSSGANLGRFFGWSSFCRPPTSFFGGVEPVCFGRSLSTVAGSSLFLFWRPLLVPVEKLSFWPKDDSAQRASKELNMDIIILGRDCLTSCALLMVFRVWIETEREEIYIYKRQREEEEKNPERPGKQTKEDEGCWTADLSVWAWRVSREAAVWRGRAHEPVYVEHADVVWRLNGESVDYFSTVLVARGVPGNLRVPCVRVVVASTRSKDTPK